jgi:hypothetical protein
MQAQAQIRLDRWRNPKNSVEKIVLSDDQL